MSENVQYGERCQYLGIGTSAVSNKIQSKEENTKTQDNCSMKNKGQIKKF
jgi:hypothetical protein